MKKKNINILDNIEIFCYKHTIKYLSFNLSHTKKNNYWFEDCARFSFREEISVAVKLVFHFSGSTIRASSDEVRQKKSDKYITHKNTNTQIHKAQYKPPLQASSDDSEVWQKKLVTLMVLPSSQILRYQATQNMGPRYYYTYEQRCILSSRPLMDLVATHWQIENSCTPTPSCRL